MADQRVLVGVIIGAHGIHGQVKIKAFTEDPASFAKLSPVCLGETGTEVAVKKAKPHKADVLIATLADVPDRTAAEGLRGTELFIPRSRLPEPEDDAEVYLDDLIGLAVVDGAGNTIGEVTAADNYGASDLLEVKVEKTGKKQLIPFTEQAVPMVDVAGGKIVIDPDFLA